MAMVWRVSGGWWRRGSELPSGKSVLLVEDDEVLRGALRLLLEWEGYRVFCAGDGEEALHLLRTGERPSLILLDALLPGLDGWEFRQEQRRDPALASIPVVVVSGHDVRGSLDAAGHVRKPFLPDELLSAIRAVG
jgi:CheY-like chemotaxis protein